MQKPYSVPFSKLHPKVATLAEKRFQRATAVQQKAFAPILANKHTLVIAPTGIGKTEAALLPVFSLMLYERKKKIPGITTLYITPLKALNRDMLSRIEWWAEHLDISISVRHGDTTPYQRSKQAKNPPELLILTPETLQSILPAKKMGQHLLTVKHVVVDEIHELIDSKRGIQLSIALERLVEKAGEFQRIGLSATVGSQNITRNFLGGSTREAALIDVSLERKLNLSVEFPSTQKQDRKLANSLHMRPSTVARLRRLHALVEAHKAVLTFVNTRSMAELLTSRYAAWDMQNKIHVHHSSLSKDVRLVAEKEFKNGSIKGIIATSSLELGIDIGHIELVTQYQSPRQASRLVQRVGRSGHSFEKTPKGIILSGDAEDCLEAGVICQHALDHKLEQPRVHDGALDVLAHQLIGLSMDFGRVSVTQAYNIIRRAYPYRDLDINTVISVLKQLSDERYVFFDETTYNKARNAFLYYFMNVSTIPDEQKFFLKNVVTHSNVGVLDESFVAENLKPGITFITKGTPWRVIDVAEREVLVEPAADFTSAIPDWEGQELPVPFSIAQAVGEARRTGKLPKAFTKSAVNVVKKSIEKQKKQGFVPSDKTIVIECHEHFCVLHTHWGSLVNETIGKALSSLLTSMTGSTIRMRADPYRFILEFPTRADPKMVKEFLLNLAPSALDGILSKTVLRSSLFRWKFIHVAKRFGLFEKGANFQRVGLRRIIEAVQESPIHDETMRDLFTEQFDLVQSKKCLRALRSGKLKLKVVNPPKVSEFASFSRRASDLFMPERAQQEITDMVSTRITESILGFECLNCHNIFYRKVIDLPNELTCPKCKGQMITLIKAKEKERVAGLINSYGKRAVMALQARGVGAESAARLLKRLRKTDKEFLNDLIEAEKTFARTKRFWA